ncbi:MAG: MerR family transcriptional regulator [Ruminococcus sp.]|nr:MerR family transcriptional regulator [Ruminococcus sp.]
MTREEVLRRYKIPAQILDEYEPQGQEYNDSDIERISTIVTLNDIGFKKEDIKAYMLLEQIGVSTLRERLEILEVKRSAILDEMHKNEKQLECLDYLRYKMKKTKE